MKSIHMLALAATLLLAGCGGREADTATPVADVKQQVDTLTVADLQAKAAEYKKEINDLKERLAVYLNALKAQGGTIDTSKK